VTAAAPAGAWPRTGMMMTFTNVGKVFDTGTVALDGVDLSVRPGEFVSVVGPSGCGKSTLLRLASGLSSPTSGEIRLGSDRLSYIFQDATLLPWRSALANVELVGELHGVRKDERRRKAMEALHAVGLDGFEGQLPARLSGGMRMRVSLARALVMSPDIFLFDEPFGALDEITRLRMQDELQRLVEASRFSSLFITHSVTEAVYLSHRVVVMSGRPGRVVHEATVPFEHPRRPEIRYDAAFARIVGDVSAALLEGSS
jgi:NitT/TauT family transport system ATP-binding protein